MSGAGNKLSWEWRVFWPGYAAARDHLAEFDFIDHPVKKSAREEHMDSYCYLPNSFLNIKIREDAILFKEMLEKSGDFCGYTPRQKFLFPVRADELPVFLPNRSETLQNGDYFFTALTGYYAGSKILHIGKKRSTATFKHRKDGDKKLKAEYSTINCNGKVFQTLCLESRHRKWLKDVVESFDNDSGIVGDYFRLLGLLASNKV